MQISETAPSKRKASSSERVSTWKSPTIFALVGAPSWLARRRRRSGEEGSEAAHDFGKEAGGAREERRRKREGSGEGSEERRDFESREEGV
jgi:hypothetical protein